MYKTQLFSQAIQKFARVWIDTDKSEKWTVTSEVRKVQTVYKTATVVDYFDVIGLYVKKIENFLFSKNVVVG